MKENPLVLLNKFGQSFWYDNISTDFIHSGELKGMIDNDGLRGITTNPSIFNKCIKEGSHYDEFIMSLPKNLTPKEVFFELACKDVLEASELLMPVYEASEGTDGFVSIEVDPNYAYDYANTVKEAGEIYKKINRKNIMIKIPATSVGLRAIKQLLVDGVNVNATLLFSVKRYDEVTEVYLEALEERLKAGNDLSEVFSVASFFISRLDSQADKLFDERLEVSINDDERDWINSLTGKVAVSNAKMAYQILVTQFSTPRFLKLVAEGAKVQKLLWASTSTKNPKYSDCLYVDELIGPKTINTMPVSTVKAFKDHGVPKRTVDNHLDHALQIMDDLEDLNINVDQITTDLEKNGVQLFINDFNSLISLIDEKRKQLQ